MKEVTYITYTTYEGEVNTIKVDADFAEYKIMEIANKRGEIIKLRKVVE